MREFEQRVKDLGLPMEQLRQAHYALSASLDDVVLNTPWGSTGIWDARSLVSTFHQEVRSGDRFFDLLDQMRQNPGTFLPVIELMYSCMSLGFQGRYRLSPHGPAELDRLREETYALIMHQRQTAEPPDQIPLRIRAPADPFALDPVGRPTGVPPPENMSDNPFFGPEDSNRTIIRPVPGGRRTGTVAAPAFASPEPVSVDDDPLLSSGPEREPRAPPSPPSINSPSDYDPLAPEAKEAPPGIPPQPDHSPHLEDAFAPPIHRVLLPEDWDHDPVPPTAAPRESVKGSENERRTRTIDANLFAERFAPGETATLTIVIRLPRNPVRGKWQSTFTLDPEHGPVRVMLEVRGFTILSEPPPPFEVPDDRDAAPIAFELRIDEASVRWLHVMLTQRGRSVGDLTISDFSVMGPSPVQRAANAPFRSVAEADLMLVVRATDGRIEACSPRDAQASTTSQ
jgi:hypothetical protein